MKKLTLSAVALALSALAIGNAAASDAPKTRDQVRAELAEARRTGEILVGDETGLKLNELHPHQYPKKVVAAGKTRAQVRAELVEAQRAGDLIADGETGQKFSELYPQQYPLKETGPSKTRAQVKAELARAIANGEMPKSDI